MKNLFIFNLMIFLLSFQNSYAQSSGSAKAPELNPAKEKEKHPQMDGIMFMMGTYSPLHSEMKGIYGTAFTLGIQHCLNMSKSMDIITSIGYASKSGNPYYDVSTFSSGKKSTIRLIPVEISLRRRMVIMQNAKSVTRGLYGGIGLNYIRAREEITDILLAKGGDLGLQIFAGPQIFLNNNLAFEAEIKLMMNSVGMKYRDNNYKLNLYGIIVKGILSWYY
jgi:hypothetical protein